MTTSTGQNKVSSFISGINENALGWGREVSSAPPLTASGKKHATPASRAEGIKNGKENAEDADKCADEE